jgi:multidrug efflux pump subunit AcrA (membrane-fusion protein)
VKLSVLAPAELIPLNPLIVRAPIDGVVDRILVEPNQQVEVGTPLFGFDSDALENRLDVAKKALATAEAEYRQRAQQALFDTDSKAQLAIAKSRIEEKQIDVNYLLTLNERAVVTSTHSGVALIDDPSQWSGRPVVTGERVLVVADQNSVIVEGWLAVSDRLQFEAGADVTLYLAADPVTPVDASLTYVANQPELQPDGNYGYRVRAKIGNDAQNARVGLKGTMRVDGERVALIYWVLRRPWAGLRGWLGI